MIPIPETALRRMRRRKVAILHKKKFYNTSYLFALWYIFSVAYNILNKSALNMAPKPGNASNVLGIDVCFALMGIRCP